MRKNSVLSLLVFCILSTLHFSNSMDTNSNGNPKVSRSHSNLYSQRSHSGLVSFNSKDGDLLIDWAVSIPFISIPLEHRVEENGEVPALLNVNTKGLGIVGLITTLFSVITPLFWKKHSHLHYRSDDRTQWLQMGNTINEMVFGNNYVAPCMQRVVCSVVSVASHSGDPTSTDKIIDGLSSHRWFKDVTNGTIIQDAVAVGRTGNQDCNRVYKDCLITPNLLRSIMNEFNIV